MLWNASLLGEGALYWWFTLEALWALSTSRVFLERKQMIQPLDTGLLNYQNIYHLIWKTLPKSWAMVRAFGTGFISEEVPGSRLVKHLGMLQCNALASSILACSCCWDQALPNSCHLGLHYHVETEPSWLCVSLQNQPPSLPSARGLGALDFKGQWFFRFISFTAALNKLPERRFLFTVLGRSSGNCSERAHEQWHMRDSAVWVNILWLGP